MKTCVLLIKAVTLNKDLSTTHEPLTTWTAAKNDVFKGLRFKPTGFLVNFANSPESKNTLGGGITNLCVGRFQIRFFDTLHYVVYLYLVLQQM